MLQNLRDEINICALRTIGFILWHAREWKGNVSFIRQKVHNFVDLYPPTNTPALLYRTSIVAGSAIGGYGVVEGHNARKRLWFSELAQHGVNCVECGVDLFSDLIRPTKETSSVTASYMVASCPSASNNYLCTREDDLARNEDEQDDLGLDHAVDETREQL